MNENITIDGDIVYIENPNELDPDGNPLMIEMTLDEYNQLLAELASN